MHGGPLKLWRTKKAAKAAKLSREEEVVARRDGIRARMIFTAFALGIGMVVTFGEVAFLQLGLGEQLEREASRNYVREVYLDDWRGDIVDRDGALLAVTVHRWSVSADPTRVHPDVVKDAAILLADLLDADARELTLRLRGDTQRAFDLANTDPTSRLARHAVRPLAQAVAKAFGFNETRFNRKLELLEHFFRTDQLRTRGVYGVVDTLDNLASVVDRVMQNSAHELRFFPSSGRRFVYLDRDIDDETARRIETMKNRYSEGCRLARREGRTCRNPLAAIDLRPEPRRYYPKRQLGTQLVGLVGSDSKGLDGIERSLDGVLAGKEHTTRIIRDRRGRAIYLEGVPEDSDFTAHTVELTIDQDIQALAENVIGKTCMASGARAGYGIVMKVDTGEVLAAASFPTFNPNTYRSFFKERRPMVDQRVALAQARDDLRWASTWPGMSQTHPGRTKELLRGSWRELARQTNAFVEYQDAYPNAARHTAFQSAYEPGSILKVLTLAAWLEEEIHPINHQYDLMDGEWDLEDGTETLESSVIGDDHRYDVKTSDPVYGLKTSSNIVYGQMGLDLGPERLEGYLRSFGLGSQTGIGFPGESRGLLREAEDWKKVETVNIAFGQGVSATGVQLVSALSGLANGGVRMKPMLIRRVIAPDGRVSQTWEPQVLERVVSERTASTVLDVMATVIEPGGTGTRAYIPEYPVAGKTGTGQKPHLRKKGYAENMWVATFFGIAPVDDPELAVLVLIDEPKGKRYGGVIAAPAFREIMRGALRHLGVPSPYDDSYQVAAIDPQQLQERRSQPKPPEESLAAAAPPVNPDEAAEVPVPDFVGMTMDQVRRTASEFGLDVRYVGTGTARSQDLEPHERVAAWSEITIVFEPRAPDASLAATFKEAAPGGPQTHRPPTPRSFLEDTP